MSLDNPSVEELLRSLRSTVEKRAKEAEENYNNEEVIELNEPVEKKAEKSFDSSKDFEPSVVGFLNQMVEKVVFRILLENQNLLKDAIERLLFTSGDLKPLFSQSVQDYLDEKKDLEPIVKEVIEKKIASILRS